MTWRRPAVVVTGALLAVVVAADGNPAWRLVRAAVALGLTAGASRAVDDGGRRLEGPVLAAAGMVAFVVGAGIGVPHSVKAGPHVLAVVGLVLLLLGVVLLGAGWAGMIRRLRGWRRVVAVPASLLAIALIAFLLVVPVAATNVPPISVGATPAAVGLDHVSVSFTTDDGVRLAGWYVASVNGAAVVLRHGSGSTRSSVLEEAAVLARHGYGVLLVDARGHGESGGRAMAFGWYGDLDTAAAVSHLSAIDGVDPDRIAVVGISMGGEEAIGAAAADDRVAAVVAEGATARSDLDRRWLSDEFGVRGWLQEQLDRVQFGVTDLLTEAGRPTPLADAVVLAGDTPVLVIAAGTEQTERLVAERLVAVAPDRVESWVVPGAGHAAALAAAPAEWEDRVIGFLDRSLGA
jgi:uncharacterized protein